MRLVDIRRLCESETGNELTLYHITDNPRFKLKKNYAPIDNSISLDDRHGRKGIYLAPDVEKWVNGYGYFRPYVAEFKVDPSVMDDPGIHGRWGGEIFVPSASFDKLTLQRVIPIDAHTREKFGGHGEIEYSTGREFETGKDITNLPASVKYGSPFKGYRYAGKDVRHMSPEEINNLQDQFKEAYRNRTGHKYPKALRRMKPEAVK